MLYERLKMAVIIFLLTGFTMYSAILYLSLPVKNKTVAPAIREGKTVWQQYNCIACHQVYGLGGYLGPDLTNVFSQKGPDYIKAFLKNGTAVMPNFQLNEQEINTLLAYLQNIDSSGKADPRTFTINKNGTIKQ